MEMPAHDTAPTSLDAVLSGARAKYEESVDFTLGIEEEYAICDPATLDLVPQFERVRDAAIGAGMENAVVGELVASEVEFRTGRCETYAEAVREVTEIRAAVSDLFRRLDLRCATSATHPWADYREQLNIDTTYYRELVGRLQYVARRNNTFGLHVHVGVHGPDRAIAVADALRDYQPLLLALSASSPFVDGRDSGLASARHMTFSRTFPRGNIAPRFRDFAGLIAHVEFLRDAGSIDTYGQMWWGVRPHAMHGTVELRMFDGQPDVRDTLGLAALACGLVAHLCDLYDAGELGDPQAEWLVDENMWRATRWGTEGRMIDPPGPRETPTRALLERIVEQAAEAGERHGLGLEGGMVRARQMVERGSPALAQRQRFQQGGSLLEAYRDVVATTMAAGDRAHVR